MHCAALGTRFFVPVLWEPYTMLRRPQADCLTPLWRRSLSNLLLIRRYMKTVALLLASRTPTTGTSERETSLEDRGEVPGRMQNAKHFHALTGSNIEDEIALKASHRH